MDKTGFSTSVQIMLPFLEVAATARHFGLDCLAVIAPPSALPADRLEAMLADGVGQLDWLARTRELRLRPSALLPSARSLLVAAVQYQPEPASGLLRRARYAAGKDYHHVVRRALAKLGAMLNQIHGQTWEHRACTDSAPVDERTLATLAGHGWRGRNGLVISPEAGSYRVLGLLLTEAPIEVHHAGHGDDRCGRCTACETTCPTGALVGRRVLTERCISYWTIEHRGVIPRPLAEKFAGWWFGCDLCQEVCPWNRRSPPAADARLTGSDDDATLLDLTAERYDQHFAGRSIRRIEFDRFRRNLLVAAFSLGRSDWTAVILDRDGHLPAVAAQARELRLTS